MGREIYLTNKFIVILSHLNAENFIYVIIMYTNLENTIFEAFIYSLKYLNALIMPCSHE